MCFHMTCSGRVCGCGGVRRHVVCDSVAVDGIVGLSFCGEKEGIFF